jgi:hypothetical protein
MTSTVGRLVLVLSLRKDKEGGGWGRDNGLCWVVRARLST